MSDRLRGQVDAAFRSQGRDHGASKLSIVFWDLSKDPTENDRALKVGSGDQTNGMAMVSFGTKSLIAKVADAITDGDIISYRQLEPDNWALRLHEEGGKGPDSVWALRNITDHENPGKERTHRSTIWVSQCRKQTWAFSQDLLWIKKIGGVGTPVSHEELSFDSAGYLSGLRGTPTGPFDRAALMLSLAKNEGYVTDGPKAAQLWHVLHLIAGGAGGRTGTGPGRTVTGPPVSPGGSGSTGTGSDDCAFTAEKELGLRGDVNFDMGGTKVHIAVTSAALTDGDQYSGNHWIFTPAPRPPGGEHAEDPKNNHKILPRSLDRGLWVWVRMPRYGVPTTPGIPPQPPPGLPPTCRPTPSGDTGDWRPPVPTSQCGYQLGVMSQTYLSGFTGTAPIPEVSSPLSPRLVIPYRLPSAMGPGVSIETALFFKYALTADELMDTAYTEIVGSITDAYDPAASDQLKLAIFELPEIRLTRNRGGGFIKYWFFRRSDDTCGIDLLVNVQETKLYLPPAGSPTPSFAGNLVAS